MIKRLFVLAVLICVHLLLSFYFDNGYNTLTVASSLATVAYLFYFFHKLGEEEKKVRHKDLKVCCPMCNNYIYLPKAPIVPKGVIEFRCDWYNCGTKISLEFTKENYEQC